MFRLLKLVILLAKSGQKAVKVDADVIGCEFHFFLIKNEREASKHGQDLKVWFIIHQSVAPVRSSTILLKMKIILNMFILLSMI